MTEVRESTVLEIPPPVIHRTEVIGTPDGKGPTATLYLADCIEVLPTLSGIQAVITDPPYSSGGTFRGDRNIATRNKYQQTGFRHLYEDFTGDTRDQRAFDWWATLWLSRARTACAEGALVCVFTDWRQLPTTTDYVQAAGFVHRGVGVWDKGEGSRPILGRFRAQAEFFVWGTSGPRAMEGPVAPGVFRVPVIGKDKEHMTAKPVELMTGLCRLSRGPVLDPFMGSGTTGVACARLRLPFVGCELVPSYFDIACRRIEAALAEPPLFEDREPAPEQQAMEL